MASAVFVGSQLIHALRVFTEAALFFATECYEMLEALSKLWCPANTQAICRSCCWASASRSPVLATLLSKAWWETRLGSFIHHILLHWISKMGEFRKRHSESNSELIRNDSDPNLKIRAFKTSVGLQMGCNSCNLINWRSLWKFHSNPDRTSFWASKPCACFGHYGSTGGTLKYGWRVEVFWGIAVQQPVQQYIKYKANRTAIDSTDPMILPGLPNEDVVRIEVQTKGEPHSDAVECEWTSNFSVSAHRRNLLGVRARAKISI